MLGLESEELGSNTDCHLLVEPLACFYETSDAEGGVSHTLHGSIGSTSEPLDGSYPQACLHQELHPGNFHFHMSPSALHFLFFQRTFFSPPAISPKIH